jgi:diacylglycerol kinase family enzyme
MPPMRRAALIYNPKSGRQRHAAILASLVSRLEALGFAVEAVPTAFAGQATALARERAESGFEVVFSYGGDGTAREVAAGLLGTAVPLGVLPGGTANLLPLALGLPRDPLSAAEAMALCRPVPFDVGLAGVTPFLMMVSMGLDARVLAALDERLKWRFGQGAVAWQGIKEWWRYGYPEMTVSAGGADGEPLVATFAALANIPYYAGAFRLAPEARTDDGLLELVVFSGRGRGAMLSFAADLLRGRHVRRRDVAVRRVREAVVAVDSERAALCVQVDGDICRASFPLTVRLSPNKLFVLARP